MEKVESNIDFNSLEPISTSNSLHIYSEEYEVEGWIYRLAYEISDVDSEPLIERKKI